MEEEIGLKSKRGMKAGEEEERKREAEYDGRMEGGKIER